MSNQSPSEQYGLPNDGGFRGLQLISCSQRHSSVVLLEHNNRPRIGFDEPATCVRSHLRAVTIPAATRLCIALTFICSSLPQHLSVNEAMALLLQEGAFRTSPDLHDNIGMWGAPIGIDGKRFVRSLAHERAGRLKAWLANKRPPAVVIRAAHATTSFTVANAETTGFQ